MVETSTTYQSQSAEIKLVSQHPFINSWSYPSNVSGLVGVGLSLASIPLVYLLTISYPDTLPGPTWITALVAYMPFIATSLLYRNSLIQIYVLTFVVLVSIWLMYPAAVEVPVYFGIPFGVGFYLLTACSLHLWSLRFNSSELVGMDWIIRYSCMFMITAYTTSMVYGNLVSHAIQFFRAPFILQPISVFGFGSFEFLVILTNACLAWWIYASISTRKIFPINFCPIQGETRRRTARRIVSNPLIVLTIVWILWIIVAGIIKAAHTTDVRNKVQVATVTIESFGEPRRNAVQLGQAIAHQAKTTNARFIVTPEFSLYVNEINRGFGHSDTLASVGMTKPSINFIHIQ